MCGGSHNADLDGLLVARFGGGEAAVFCFAVVSFDGVADIIGEHSNAVHLRHILFQCAALCRQRRVAGCPALAVDENRRIDFFQFRGNLVHSLYIMDSHKVEAEAVDMIFLCPIFHRVDNKLTHHLAFRGGLVAATRGVAVASVGAVAVEISRSSEREV